VTVTVPSGTSIGTTTLTLPTTGGTIQTSGSGYTTNGVAYASSTSALATGTGLTFDGTNLGVGTTSPSYKGQVTATVASGGGGWVFGVQETTRQGGLVMGSYGTTNARVGAIQGLWWGNAAADLLINPDGGNVLVGTTSVDGAGSKVQLSSSQNRVFTIQNTANVNGDQLLWLKVGSNCNTSASPIFICDTAGTNRLIIYGNGNVQNSNNSYGGFSDIKLKENIVDASPKLADLMQVKIRNYNLKTDPDHKQLGVVAQELETIFPSMIEESPDRDAEGNVLETTTKSVKYSVFVPMLIKSIQELSALVTAQSATITSLTERITALEGK
jgi:hypothetical protein